MLLQTNSYVVPKEKRSEHVRLLRRFKQVLHKLGCDHFEVYEQVGTNWTSDQTSGRFVQIMRFRDRKQQMAVQAAERDDPMAQAVIAEFCELINFPYQQQQGLFAIGYYTSILSSGKVLEGSVDHAPAPPPEPSNAVVGAVGEQMTMVVGREELAEAIDEGKPHPEGELPPSPFADAPIVVPAEPVSATAPTNGDGHHDEVASPDTPGEGTHVVGNDLDELIRQRFGEVRVSDNGQSRDDLHSEMIDNDAEPVGSETDVQVHSGELIESDAGRVEPPAKPDVVDEPLVGSGIGAVLDASLHGDDPDLDIALPAELLEPPDSSHAPRRSHAHNEELGHG